MEKPEWFKAVEASKGAPESTKMSSARARTTRLTHGFALFGIAAVIAASGLAFAQSNNATSAGALAFANPTTARTSSPATTSTLAVATSVTNATSQSAPSAIPATSGTGTGQSAISLVGGRPSIVGSSGGDDGGGNDG